MPPPWSLVILPGLDGGSLLARPFVERLPPTLVPTPLDLPADEYLDQRRLLDWVGRRLPREPFFLLAQSFTTPLALELARRHPVRGLVLVTPLSRPPRCGLGALRLIPRALLGIRPPRLAVRWLLLGRDAPAELLDAFAASLSSLPAAVLAGRVRELPAVFASIRDLSPPCPTLCLHAAEDRLLTGPCPRRDTERVRHVVLHGPHLLLPRRPAEVAAEVARFVATLSDG
jgi:pimeloyl-ACP methyl ester carboxylesterase